MCNKFKLFEIIIQKNIKRILIEQDRVKYYTLKERFRKETQKVDFDRTFLVPSLFFTSFQRL